MSRRPTCPLNPVLVWILRLLATLPWSWQFAIGRTLGRLLGSLMRSRKRIAGRNLELCFPELEADERAQLLCANLEASGIGIMEMLVAWFGPADKLHGRIELIGREFLPPPGRPLLLLSAHFTMVELGPRLLIEATGRAFDLLVRRNNRACIEQLFDRGRRRFVNSTIDKQDVRGLLHALREGPGVLYAPDQHFARGAAHLPFFGVPASTLLAAPRLARSAGAELLLFAFRRLPDGRYRVELEPVPADWPRQDAEAFTRRWLEWLEFKVRLAPEQYLWVHRRFRSVPPGMPLLYHPGDLRDKHRR
jgi:KDO2-lipid IV(A) lauroyltransferase